MCEDGHCLIYKRRVHHRGPAFDNPNTDSGRVSTQRDDLENYIKRGDYDRTCPQEKGTKYTSGQDFPSGHDSISDFSLDLSSRYISATYIEPRKNIGLDSVPDILSGTGYNSSRPPSTSEMTEQTVSRLFSISEESQSNQ